MYMILGLVMLLRGFRRRSDDAPAAAMAFGDNMGYLPPHHYDQIFTAPWHDHDLLRWPYPADTRLMNFVVPLQIGARDVVPVPEQFPSG